MATPMLIYCHPTTVIFIDDNQLFLRGLDVELPNPQPIVLHHDPFRALDAVNATLATPTLADRVFDHREHSADDASALLHLDLSLIEQEITHADRFRRVSAAIVDYAMPSMDGLEFCRGMTNPDVLKVLLTGVADEKLAVAAFNEGLIDMFVPKQDAVGAPAILSMIERLEQRYFRRIQDRLRHAIADSLPGFLDDPQFEAYFRGLIDKYGIVEYYLVGQPPGFLMLDRAGTLRRLLVADSSQLEAQTRYAERHGAPSGIREQLRSGATIGCFYEPVETFFDEADFPWQEYMFAARPVSALHHAAVMESPPVDIDYDPSLSSLDAFMASLAPRLV